MKRNRLFILGIVTVLVALLSLTLVSGTFAKYTSSATASDSARVAKYLVKYNTTAIDQANQTDPAITFDLFGSLKEDNATTAETSDHVKAIDGSLIAPGTGGEVSFTLTNESEVMVSYALNYTVNNAGVPLEYRVKVDTGDFGSWASTISNVAATNLPHTSSNTVTYTIQWRWVFENGEDATLATNDAADTALGVAAQTTPAQPTVSVNVLFTQVD